MKSHSLVIDRGSLSSFIPTNLMYPTVAYPSVRGIRNGYEFGLHPDTLFHLRRGKSFTQNSVTGCQERLAAEIAQRRITRAKKGRAIVLSRHQGRGSSRDRRPPGGTSAAHRRQLYLAETERSELTPRRTLAAKEVSGFA